MNFPTYIQECPDCGDIHENKVQYQERCQPCIDKTPKTCIVKWTEP